MATYKVIQDIEAEEHLFWRLSLRQLIYALIAAGLIGLGYALSKTLGAIPLILFILVALPFIFLALPLGRDQPNDVWLLAQLNFLLKPKKRLWQQIGNSYAFLTISHKPSTPATKVVKSLSTSEVDSRIQNLSSLLDGGGQALSVDLQPEVAGWEDQQAQEAHKLDKLFHKLLSGHQNRRQEHASQRLHRKTKMQPLQADNLDDSSKPAGQLPSLEQLKDFKIETLEQMLNRQQQPLK